MIIKTDILEIPGRVICNSLKCPQIVSDHIKNSSGDSFIPLRIIYNESDMVTYVYPERLVCYLGNDVGIYLHGSFWERIVEDSRIFLRQLDLKIDLSSLLHLSGGEMSGDITTKNLIPTDDNLQSIGSAEKKYNSIYVERIHSSAASFSSVETNALSSNSIGITDIKQTIDINDSLPIHDSQSNNIVKSNIIFTKENNKYLDSSGNFTSPQQEIVTSEDMDISNPKVGMLVQYTGESNYLYSNKGLYVYKYLPNKFRIEFYGQTPVTYNNNGEIDVNSFSNSNELITKIQNIVINQSVKQYIKDNGKIVIYYQVSQNYWYVEDYEEGAIRVTDSPADIINTLISNNSTYFIDDIPAPGVLKIIITSYYFAPFHQLTFPYDDSKVLNGVNEWVDLNNNHLFVTLVHSSQTYNDFSINGLDSIVTPGLYYLHQKDVSIGDVLLGELEVSNYYNAAIYQKVKIYFPYSNDVNLEYMSRSMDLYSVLKEWTNWEYVYNVSRKKSIIIHSSQNDNILQTPTIAMWTTLFTDTTIATPKAYTVIIGGVKGFLLTRNSFVQNSLTEPTFLENFDDNIIDESLFRIIKTDNLSYFFPANYRRIGNNVSSFDVDGHIGCIYYASNGEVSLYFDSGATLNMFHASNEFTAKYMGYAVRLIDKYGQFTSSNLQYNVSLSKFRMALKPNDVIGISQHKTQGWIDLFGYATSGYNNNPNNRSVNSQEYDFDMLTDSRYDWGIYNSIYEINDNSYIDLLI